MAKSECETKLEIELIMPKMAKVVMLNDDYTTMDFVIATLVDIFNKSISEAEVIMLKIHNEGSGICGIYPHDIAHTKANLARARAKNAGFPLRILVEDIKG